MSEDPLGQSCPKRLKTNGSTDQCSTDCANHYSEEHLVPHQQQVRPTPTFAAPWGFFRPQMSSNTCIQQQLRFVLPRRQAIPVRGSTCHDHTPRSLRLLAGQCLARQLKEAAKTGNIRSAWNFFTALPCWIIPRWHIRSAGNAFNACSTVRFEHAVWGCWQGNAQPDNLRRPRRQVISVQPESLQSSGRRSISSW